VLFAQTHRLDILLQNDLLRRLKVSAKKGSTRIAPSYTSPVLREALGAPPEFAGSCCRKGLLNNGMR
jgi:hypothetical protein